MSSKIQRVLSSDMSLTPQFIAYRLLSGDNPFNIAMLEGSNIETTIKAIEIIVKLMPKREEIINELDTAIKMKAQLSLPAHIGAMVKMDEESLSKLMTIKFVTDQLEESERKNIIDARDNNIKYDEKTFTCRGCNYVPSKMLGAGRKKNLSEFQEHAQKINYIIVDNTEFPKIQLVFISGNDLLLNYPNGKISIRDRVDFFSRY